MVIRPRFYVAMKIHLGADDIDNFHPKTSKR
jgi:hypothetical protein